MKEELVKFFDPDDECWYIDYVSETVLTEGMQTNTVISLKELADSCDQNAESRNNFGFIGTHRLLAVILFQQVGEEKATEIMRIIAEHRGLDEMSGNQAEGAFADFGITEPWNDWNFPCTPVKKNEERNRNFGTEYNGRFIE